MKTERRITIALDARTIHRPHRRGTGKNLIDLYRHVLGLRPDWRVLGYHRAGDDGEHTPAGLADCDRYEPRQIEMPSDRVDAWQRWRLPFAAWRDAADVVHFPANTCSTWCGMSSILTVHDLLPLWDEPARAHRFERSVRNAVHRKWTIVTPSRYTATQLVEQFDADSSRIEVIGWAADSGMKRVTDAEELAEARRKYGVPGRYCLHLGAAEARKNTDRVVVAYAQLPASLREGCRLLIVGLDDAAHRSRIEGAARQLGIESALHVHGFADESDMGALISGAEVLVYPSLSEGYGLPILDAWSCRTAVLTSTTTSLPEVAGDAALCVEPSNTSEIRMALAALIDSASLREDLVERGMARSAGYTWEGTASRFIGVVEQAARAETAQTAA